MLRAVKKEIARWDMLSPGDKVLCALSGGADSVALLQALCVLQKEYEISVCAVHVNHQLRGAESERDEAFVRMLCKEKEILLRVYRVAVSARAEAEKKSIELAAREARYECFQQAAEELKAQKIATAHTQNDNAETMLHHFIRGTGMAGLAGIPPVRDCFIRPLLEVNREEILAYLKEEGLSYVEDSTNQTDDYTRNRIRHQLIPLIEQEFNPSFLRAASVLAGHMTELSAHCSCRFNELEREIKKGAGLSVKALLNLDGFERSGVLKAFLGKQSGTLPEAKHVAAAQALIKQEKNSWIHLPGGFLARVSFGVFTVEKKDENAEPFEVELPLGETILPQIQKRFVLERLKGILDENVHNLFNTAILDYDKIASSLIVRCRKEGDRYQIPGGKHKTVKKLMIEKKIDALRRDTWPLVVSGEEILWIPGSAPAPCAAIGKETKNFLKISLCDIEIG